MAGITDHETRRLLAVAMSYDNRKPAEAAVLAWGEAASRGRWTFDEAIEAAHAHYTESTDFLMPAHITRRIKAARQDIAMRNPADPPDRAGQERLAALIAGTFQEIPDGWRDDALTRCCPACNAQPGEQCTRESAEGRRATRIPHPARMKPDRAAP